ncbi:hypothetical protein ACO0RG_002030 [Hanseniaspora osmophila]
MSVEKNKIQLEADVTIIENEMDRLLISPPCLQDPQPTSNNYYSSSNLPKECLIWVAQIVHELEFCLNRGNATNLIVGLKVKKDSLPPSIWLEKVSEQMYSNCSSKFIVKSWCTNNFNAMRNYCEQQTEFMSLNSVQVNMLAAHLNRELCNVVKFSLNGIRYFPLKNVDLCVELELADDYRKLSQCFEKLQD